MSGPSGGPTPEEIRALIGDPLDRDGPADFGMALEAQLLRDYGHPDELRDLADRLDALPADPEFPEAVARLRDLSEIVRHALERVEAAGLVFRWGKQEDFKGHKWPPQWSDPAFRGLRIPRETGSGAPEKLMTRMVWAAWQELRPGRKLKQLDADTFAAIRDRLFHLLPPEELTDAKIKGRLNRWQP